MAIDPDNREEQVSSIPEPVLTWLSRGRPRPVPAPVREWLEQDPGHGTVLDELGQVWEATPPADAPADLWPGIERRLRDTTQSSSTRRESRPTARWTGPLRLAAVLVLGLGLGLVWPEILERVGAPADLVVVEVPAGSKSSLTFPGGVTVQLNSASRLSYRPEGDEVEAVRLEGEGFFRVEHDPAREFSVLTDAGVIRDIGTVFNVRAREDRVSVVVAEGEVALTAAGVTLNVTEGQKAGATAVESPRIEPDFLLSAELAWLEGRFAFHDTRLEEIGTALERHYDIAVQVAPRLADRRVTLVLNAPAEPGSALDIVCQAVSTRCQRTGDTWLIGSDG